LTISFRFVLESLARGSKLIKNSQEVSQIAKLVGATVNVIQGEELNKRGFGGIYGVGKAASVPPALVVLSHYAEAATVNVAWVGKGIVYDTGGLSIKGKVAKIPALM
jgi:probable aminopeptidase NPEPL1